MYASDSQARSARAKAQTWRCMRPRTPPGQNVVMESRLREEPRPFSPEALSVLTRIHTAGAGRTSGCRLACQGPGLTGGMAEGSMKRLWRHGLKCWGLLLLFSISKWASYPINCDAFLRQMHSHRIFTDCYFTWQGECKDDNFQWACWNRRRDSAMSNGVRHAPDKRQAFELLSDGAFLPIAHELPGPKSGPASGGAGGEH